MAQIAHTFSSTTTFDWIAVQNRFICLWIAENLLSIDMVFFAPGPLIFFHHGDAKLLTAAEFTILKLNCEHMALSNSPTMHSV